MTELLTQPIVQYGFAGLSAALLGLVGWMVYRLFQVLEGNTEVIRQNTAASEQLSGQAKDLEEKTDELIRLDRKVHDRLLSRPCLKEQ